MMRAVRFIAITSVLMLGAIETHGANSPNALDLPPSNVMPAPVDMSPNAPQRTAQSDPSGP